MSLIDLDGMKDRQDACVDRQSTAPPHGRRLKRWDQRPRVGEAALEESLSSALLASDKELGQIVREVDKISTSLKTGAPDAQSLRVAQHPAVWGAVKQTLLERELHHLALTDELTCLYNRRGFFAAATQLLNLARRKEQPALLLFCDVDRLSLVNNTLGYREGDLTLIRAADALEQTFRQADVIARIGGDEFVALILEAPSQVEGILLDRLEKSFRKLGANSGRHGGSLSVGVAWFDPKQAVTLGELISRAEEAMNERRCKHREPRTCQPPAKKEATLCETQPTL
jgi:diguanylate cyclase (GGDEF)-like protein